MHQPTDIHLTAKDLSQEESKLYRKRPYQHLQNRQDERRPVISPETFELLQELLEFRHVFHNIYGEELDYDKTEKIAWQIDELYGKLSEELNIFVSSLEK